MKKVFLSLAIFVMVICANAQTNQYFWFNGNLLMGNPIAQIDSVTFGNEETDSILIYLPRTIIKNIVVHDTIIITVHDTIRLGDTPEGALAGVFSVSETKKVRFSKGNLQYQASTDTWRFAENQWDFVGESNDGRSLTYSGWIDLFGWGTGANPTNSSDSYTDYQNFVDWGTNTIENIAGDTWRTITKEEYEYLFNSRDNAKLLYGQATVNNIYGLILLPDYFSLPDGLSFTPIPNNWTANKYSIVDWQLMEKNGAVFLPAAGWRGGSGGFVPENSGSYWSSTPYGNMNQFYLLFYEDIVYPTTNYSYDVRQHGHSVRLVQDVDNTTSSSSESTTIVHDTIKIIVHDTVYVHDCAQDIEENKNEYFWLECNQDFLIHWRNFNCNIEYSYDKITWTTAVPMYGGETPENFMPVPANTKIYLRGINGSNNSFWYDWTGCFHTNTEQILSLSTEQDKYTCRECFGAELSAGGNILSMVFGDEFVERANDTVHSTLSRICCALGMLTDASLLYVNPAAYGTNNGYFSNYGNQWGLFAGDYNLKKGPYIKYLKSHTFYDCESLTDIYYIGDGSEISGDTGSEWYEIEGGSRWFNENTSKNVETLTIHVKPGVQIPYKPANAVVVEDL